MTAYAETTSSATPSPQTSQGSSSGGSSGPSHGGGTSAARGSRGAVRQMAFSEGDAYMRPASAAARTAPAGAVQAKESAATDRSDRLPADLGDKMSSSLGADLSDVRVHQDGEADAVGAKAFTRGSDVHFARGAYDPGSTSGQALIGHELAHVVQQRAGRVGPGGGGAGAEGAQAKAKAAGVKGRVNSDPSLEAEADVLGAKAARGESARVPGASGASGASASDEALQGFFPAISGLGSMVAKAFARDGAIRLAKHAAIGILREQLPALQEQAVAAARAAVMASPDVQRAMAQLGQLEEVRTLVDGLVAPLSARISAYLSARAELMADALRAQLPDIAPLIPAGVRAQATAVRARLGALLPTQLVEAAKQVLLESATAGLISGAVHKAGELVSGSVVEGAVGAAKTAGEAAITPFVEAGQEAMAGAQGMIDTAGAVADMVPGLPGQRLVNKGVSAATEALAPAPKLSDLAGEVEGVAAAPKAAVVDQAEQLRKDLQAKGKGEYAKKLGTLIQVYTVTRDVTEAQNAEDGINAVLKAGATWLGAAAGAAISAGVGAKGTKGAMVSAATGTAIGVALNFALKKVNIGGHLASAGRALGRQEGVVGTAARGAYVGGKAVVDAARLPVRGVGVLWGGVKSLVTMDSKHVRDAASGVGEAWSTLASTGASARDNMDPSKWTEPPKPAGGGRERPSLMRRLAMAQARKARIERERAAGGGGAGAGPSARRPASPGAEGSVRGGGASGGAASGGAASGGERRRRPRPKPEELLAIDLSGVEAAVNSWQAGLIAAFEGASATPEATPGAAPGATPGASGASASGASASGASAEASGASAGGASAEASGASASGAPAVTPGATSGAGATPGATPDAKGGARGGLDAAALRVVRTEGLGMLGAMRRPMGALGGGMGMGPGILARSPLMGTGGASGAPTPAPTAPAPDVADDDAPVMEEVD